MTQNRNATDLSLPFEQIHDSFGHLNTFLTIGNTDSRGENIDVNHAGLRVHGGLFQRFPVQSLRFFDIHNFHNVRESHLRVGFCETDEGFELSWVC